MQIIKQELQFEESLKQSVEYTTYTKNKMNVVLRAILAFGYGTSIQKSYEIYTPTGTILKTFQLDTQYF